MITINHKQTSLALTTICMSILLAVLIWCKIAISFPASLQIPESTIDMAFLEASAQMISGSASNHVNQTNSAVLASSLTSPVVEPVNSNTGISTQSMLQALSRSTQTTHVEESNNNVNSTANGLNPNLSPVISQGYKGVQLNLGNRIFKVKPIIDNNNTEEGTVQVDIRVDKFGHVFYADPNGRHTNTTSEALKLKAKNAAKNMKFNESEMEEQRGSITFVFSY